MWPPKDKHEPAAWAHRRDCGGRRPMPCGVVCRFTKTMTHRKERRRNDRLVRKKMEAAWLDANIQ